MMEDKNWSLFQRAWLLNAHLKRVASLTTNLYSAARWTNGGSGEAASLQRQP
jgi:hypothetical protein